MWRHIASNALTFLVVLTFLGGGVILWGQTQYRSAGPLEEQICLRVERGATMRSVSRQLAAALRSGVLRRSVAMGLRRSGYVPLVKAEAL